MTSEKKYISRLPLTASIFPDTTLFTITSIPRVSIVFGMEKNIKNKMLLIEILNIGLI